MKYFFCLARRCLIVFTVCFCRFSFRFRLCLCLPLLFTFLVLVLVLFIISVLFTILVLFIISVLFTILVLFTFSFLISICVCCFNLRIHFLKQQNAFANIDSAATVQVSSFYHSQKRININTCFVFHSNFLKKLIFVVGAQFLNLSPFF